MHGYEILIVLTDVFSLILITGLEGELLEHILKPNCVTDIFGIDSRLKGLKLGQITGRKAFLYFLHHHLLCLNNRSKLYLLIAGLKLL
jgi:hypothetical protein